MRIFLAVCVVWALVFGRSHAEDAGLREGSVVVVPIKGDVNQAQFFFLRRMLKEAEAARAAAFIIDMDTYGGSLSTAVEMLEMLMKATIPTFTYVNTNAGSAGTMIALSTRQIYMAPVSAIGAAAPVTGDGQDLQETMKDKTVSYFSKYFSSAAERNGYNPEVVEAFINKEKEVKIGDVVINPKGTLLTLSAQEATRVIDGKPVLSAGVAADVGQLCELAGLPGGAVVRMHPSGFETIALWITALAPLFMLGGMLGAWIEFKTPGFGVAGVLSLLCFTLFFAGHFVAGLTGFEVLAVFVLGVVFVVVELVFFPGTVFLAALGMALMLGSLLFAMVDFYPSQPLTISPEMLLWPLVNLGLAMFLFVVAMALLARFLPDLPLFNRLVLAARQEVGTSLAGPATSPRACRVQVGDAGVALSPLRPAGRAEFGREVVDVITDGEFVEAGSAVRVAAVRPDRVVVAPA